MVHQLNFVIWFCDFLAMEVHSEFRPVIADPVGTD